MVPSQGTKMKGIGIKLVFGNTHKDTHIHMIAWGPPLPPLFSAHASPRPPPRADLVVREVKGLVEARRVCEEVWVHEGQQRVQLVQVVLDRGA